VVQFHPSPPNPEKILVNQWVNKVFLLLEHWCWGQLWGQLSKAELAVAPTYSSDLSEIDHYNLFMPDNRSEATKNVNQTMALSAIVLV
jgi:hypothetical protein